MHILITALQYTPVIKLKMPPNLYGWAASLVLQSAQRPIMEIAMFVYGGIICDFQSELETHLECRIETIPLRARSELAAV